VVLLFSVMSFSCVCEDSRDAANVPMLGVDATVLS
jgi:hypothetical protein